MAKKRREQVAAYTEKRAEQIEKRIARVEGRAKTAESKGRTRRAEKLRRREDRLRGRVDKVNRRRANFGLDPVTGRPTEGDDDGQQVMTDENGGPQQYDPYAQPPTINVYMQGGGDQYGQGSFVPQQPRQVTDRTKLDLANQVGNL